LCKNKKYAIIPINNLKLSSERTTQGVYEPSILSVGAIRPLFFGQKPMNITNKLKSYLYNRLAKELSTGGGGANDPFAIWRTGSSKKLSPARAMAQYKNWVYSAVKAIADELAATEIRAFQMKADGTSEELLDHEVLDMLNAPNPYMTGDKLRFLTSSHLELTGNAYWHLYGVKDLSQKPSAIYALPPQDVTIVRGTYPELIKEYRYRDGQTTHTFKPFEIIHFDYADPNDPVEGIGTVQAVWDWIESDELAQEFNKKFYENGARLSGLIEHPSAFNADQMNFIKKSFEQIYSGVQNAYRTAVLPTGAKFQQVSASPKELDFQESGKNNRDKILGGFRVPKTALGLTEDVNRANAEATDYVFASRAIGPKRKHLISYLNEFFVSRFGDGLWLDFHNTIPDDKDAKTREMQAATGNQPVISINEAREKYYGLGPIENGNAVRGDLMKQPVGEPIKSANQAVIKTVKKAIKSRYAKNNDTRKKISKEIGEKMAEVIKEFKEQEKEAKTKAAQGIAKMSDGEFEILYKSFANRVNPYKDKITDGVKEVNESLRKEVRGNLSKLLKSTKGIDMNELFNGDNAVKSITDMASPILSDLYTTEAAAAVALIGIEGFEVLPDTVKTAIERAVGLLSSSYTDSMRELLKAKLTESMAEGPDLDVLTKRVNEIFDFQNEIRANQVATTETFRIGNEATVEAWKQTGVVKTKKWYTAEDERVCESCGPMHGEVIDIEKNFFDLGDTTDTGAEITYDDVNFPPLHVSCRCYVRPEDIEI